MRNWHFSNFYFFYFTTVGIIVPYWSLYLKHKGFGATEIGQLMAILLITKVIAPNLWAAAADNIALKKGSSLGLLKFASAATLFVFAMTYWANSFWIMGFFMFGFCMFWNACLPQLEAATLNHLGSNKDQYGLIRLWGSLGFIASVLGVGWIIDHTGPSTIMPAGAVAFLLMLGASLYMRDGYQATTEQQRIAVPLARLLNSKVLILLMLCLFMQISHAPFYTFFSIYLENYGYSKLHIGGLWSAGVVFEILVFIYGFKLLRRFKLSSLLSFTFAIAGVRWLLVASLPENALLIFVSQVMHAVTYGLYHSVMIQIIDRLFQGRYQVRGQALYSSITYGVGGAIGSLTGGSIWTAYGANQLFYLAGAMMILVFGFSMIVTPILLDNASAD